MRSFILLSVLSAALLALPAQAQYRDAPPQREVDGVGLVNNWTRQYLHRAPNREDVRHGRQINDGTMDPTTELAGILGCEEYYQKQAGGEDGRYVQKLFRDVIGRPPSGRERNYWEDRLSQTPQSEDARINFAIDFLQQFPPQTAPPPVESPLRRPYDR